MYPELKTLCPSCFVKEAAELRQLLNARIQQKNEEDAEKRRQAEERRQEKNK